jgi:hypothetical protein
MANLHGKRIQTMISDNLTWAEEETGLWKGWVYSSTKKRYYFNDIGSESLMELWEDQWKWEDANEKSN